MSFFRNAHAVSKFLGFDHKVTIKNVSGLGWFIADYKKMKAQLKNNPDFKKFTLYTITSDKSDSGGSAKGHYFHQDLLVAQKIFKDNPVKHVDVGSRIDGFVAHVAAFREIEVFDIRPIESNVQNMRFIQCDFMNVDASLKNYADSLSCLHVIEHFGLGRYGDPIDVDGHIKGLAGIYEVLKPGGKFYLSTPIGEQRMEFNGQRVFDVSYLLNLFKDKFVIDNFSFVDDAGDLHKNVNLSIEQVQKNFNCHYGAFLK